MEKLAKSNKSLEFKKTYESFTATVLEASNITIYEFRSFKDIEHLLSGWGFQA